MSDTFTPLEIYAREVEKDAKEGTDYLYHNEGNDHARIICTNIFKNAKTEIRIAANRLYNDEVVNTPEYISSMKEFLDKPKTILKILIVEAPKVEDVKKDNTFYGMLFEHPAFKEGRITIKEGRGKSFSDNNGNKVNFCTADDRMYRYETDITRRKAVANFGDQKRSKELKEIFDRVYDKDGLTFTVDLNNYFM